ncbi:MAG: enoyl-CoA hydratase/isomerase family protein [Deltaproteobacteria bacterium]|nr:enoyl-CoA hydratase/isomerase family protein [Deltaproteobacteria bacterium]MBW2256090.1 enoyl-CoA hydratase/isomerase family protein [Deltaproteobacteria bacterium]
MSERPLEEQIRVETRDQVRWLVLDRPESRNALTLDAVDFLNGLLQGAAEDPAVRVLVLAGAHGAFCSGIDLKVASRTPDWDVLDGLARFQSLARALDAVMKPTIAAIDGPAAGFGADLAFGCDLRLACETALIGTRFIRIGLMPDGGGTWFLPRLVGLGKAYELMYSGRMVGAEEAERIGLVNQVLPREGFLEAVQRYAAHLAEGPPLAFARVKEALKRQPGDLHEGLEMEAAGQRDLLGSRDFLEGVQAFLEKRKARFEGR